MTTDQATGDRANPLGQQIYDRLLAKLVSLEIEPNDRITVDALARELGVSQTPVREALSLLVSDGLVVKSHLRGFRAAPSLSKQEFEDFYDFRLLLEPAAAERAAARGTAEELDELRQLEQCMRERHRCTTSESAYSEFAALDAKFHSAIASASHNRHIFEGIARLHVHVHIFRLMRDAQIATEAVEEHRFIVEAIEAHHPGRAAGAMRSHVERSRDRILTAFD